MGLLFNGTTQYLHIASAPVTAVPMSMSLWIKPVSVSIQQYFLCISSVTPPDFDIFGLSATNTTAFAEASNTNGSTDIGPNPTITLAAGTLYHFCAIWASITSITAYINGGNSANVTTSCTPTAANLNTTTIGAVFPGSATASNWASASIYFPAIWNAALTLGDVTSLAAGISPRKIRPANLLRYPRLTGHSATEPDLKSSTGWTVTAAPTESANVRVYFP